MDRKARLAALAAKAGRTENIVGETTLTEKSPNPAEEETSNVEENLAHLQLQANKPVKPPTRSRPDTKVKEKTALELALEQAQADLFNNTSDSAAAPAAQKKLNWDLKRDIQPKLDILEQRTQRAIVQLLKERLDREVEEEEEKEVD